MKLSSEWCKERNTFPKSHHVFSGWLRFFIERHPTIPNNIADSLYSIPRLNHWKMIQQNQVEIKVGFFQDLTWQSASPNLTLTFFTNLNLNPLEFFTSFWRFEKKQDPLYTLSWFPQISEKKTTPLLKTPCAGHEGFFLKKCWCKKSCTSWSWYKKIPSFTRVLWPSQVVVWDIWSINMILQLSTSFPSFPRSKSRRLASKKSKRSFTKRGDRFRSFSKPKWVEIGRKKTG